MKKVLVLGTPQNNFKAMLYGEIKKNKDFADKFTFINPSIHNLDKTAGNDWMYENSRLKHNVSFLDYCYALYRVFSLGEAFRIFLFILLGELKPIKAIHYVKELIRKAAFFKANKNFKNIDTFHFHFIQYSYLRELILIGKNKRIICSFWGSDLLRTHDTFNHFLVKRSLKRANVITCQSWEMREIILSKFGRNLAGKIKLNKFILDKSLFDRIDSFDGHTDRIEEFKKIYGFSSIKKNLLIGHSGSPENNHLKIIESLKEFNQKDELHIIVNLNYAIDEKSLMKYKVKIINKLEELGLNYTLLQKFFVGEELALSRLATDIFIHLPVSDALSATLTEMIYAGAEVITGKWLPYNLLRNEELISFEVEEFGEIPFQLNKILDENRKPNHQKKDIIRQTFLDKNIAEKWVEIIGGQKYSE